MMETTGFSVADLDDTPDDGNRYELMEGAMVVNPPPSLDHQNACVNLIVLLQAACPEDLKVTTAPFGLRINDTTELQPDLAVAPKKMLTGMRLEEPPLVVVEILSPSTAQFDQTIKAGLYATFGIPTYLVVSIAPTASVTEYVLDADTGIYSTAQHVTAGKPFALTSPVTVTFDPAELVS